MKKYFQRLISVLIICIISSSCAANQEAKKKQSQAFRNVGEAYIREENYTLALKELLKAEKIYANDPFLQNDLGFAYMGKEKLDLAIMHFKKAVELDPNFAPARNNLGTAYIAKKDWDSAIATLEEVTKNILYATPHYPRSNLGWAYYNKGEYELSEKYYKESLKLRPNFIPALRGIGRTYIAMEKIPKALEYLKKAVKQTHPGARINPELYFDLARAYKLLNNKKKALDAYRKVVALAPDSDLAEEAGKEIKKLKK